MVRSLSWRAARVLAAQQPYNLPEGSACTDGIVTPSLRYAFRMFAAYYNYCWRTRKPGKSGKRRPTAAMMAKLTDHLWSFDELFEVVTEGH